jgi:hypothetical protein
MPKKMINEFNESTSPTDTWFVLVDDGLGNYYKVKLSNLNVGSGLIQLATPVLTATPNGSNVINLTWVDVSNESSYLLEWSANGSSGWTQIGGTIAADSTSYSHTGLNAVTAYYYRLKAIGDGVTYSNSEYSVIANATTTSIDSDAQTFLTAAAITDPTITNAINNLVTKMKSDGVWSKMDAIYPFVGGSSSAHAVNLKQPGTFNLTFNGTWTHAATGAKPNGTDGYANTGYVPRTNLTQFSSAVGLYSRDNPTLSASEYRVFMGVQKSGIDTGLTYYNASGADRLFGTAGSNTNSGYNEGVLENPRTGFNKLLVISRTANNVIKMYRNGAQVSTTNTATTVENNPETYNMYIGASNIDGTATYFASVEYAFAFMGDGLNDANVTNLNDAVVTFETALSRNV